MGSVHATAMNISRSLLPPYSAGTLANTIQTFIAETEKAGGILIVDHPNYHPNLQWKLNAHELRSTEGLTLFELYNGHPLAHTEGDSTHVSTEAMWDMLLTQGMKKVM